MEQFIIGRAGNQPFKIPADKKFVSHEHAIIQIDDYGRWSITDNNSNNGVYVRNADGDFERVYQAEITPATVIRLGPENVRSFEFWAQRVKASNPDDFSSEFMYLKQMLAMFKETETQVEKKAERYNWIASFSGMAATAIFGMYMLFGPDKDKGVDATGMMIRMSIMSAVPPIVKACLPKPAKQLKAMREQRAKLIRCPNCGAPLSDFAVNQGKCPMCKAC